MRRFAALKRRSDFARVRRHGRRSSTKNLVIYCSDSPAGDPRALVGISVSKSIGKAVTRNKLRRRLAAILHEALASDAAVRLLVIPRPEAAGIAFADLRSELASALTGA